MNGLQCPFADIQDEYHPEFEICDHDGDRTWYEGFRVFRFAGFPIRTILDDKGNPWWVATDVARVLNFRDAWSAVRGLDEDERGTHILCTPGGDQPLTIINEPGLYSLILRSTKPEARRFKKWIVSEVLPAIRKNGQYSVEKIGRRELAQMVLEAEAEIDRANRKIAELAPRAQGYDRVCAADNAQTMATVAKVLGTGRDRLFAFLRDKGVLQTNNLPYQRYLNAGYFKVIEKPIAIGDKLLNHSQTLVTPKGLDYIRRIIERFRERLDVA